MIAGRHDFNAFRALDKSKPDESTIVVVKSAEIGVDDHLIVFRIEASHFIWKMVRRLTGTLVKVGKLDIDGASEWYTRRARFGSSVPLEYAYAGWGALPKPAGGPSVIRA